MVAGREATGRMGPGACVAPQRRAQYGIHRQSRTAYPAARRGHVRQPVAGLASMKTARAVARATPTKPEPISGYLELSTLRSLSIAATSARRKTLSEFENKNNPGSCVGVRSHRRRGRFSRSARQELHFVRLSQGGAGSAGRDSNRRAIARSRQGLQLRAGKRHGIACAERQALPDPQGGAGIHKARISRTKGSELPIRRTACHVAVSDSCSRHRGRFVLRDA